VKNDDEIEGFLTPARADAIAANLVDVGHVEVDYAKMRLPIPLIPPPWGVTPGNWRRLKAAGWQWLTNIAWPYSGAIVEGIKVRHGNGNVLIGWPGDEGTKEPTGRILGKAGVYVLENLQLPESVRKFIAEHEEKP